MRAAVLALAAFVVMEPVTYAAHRWLMHGPGAVLHASHHHAGRGGGWEANDLYPLAFGSAVCLALAVGYNVAGLGALVPVCVGITLYGAAYGLVHDGVIHGRVPGVRRLQWRWLARLAEAHRVHHLYGGEPYGMLLPVVPGVLRARAAGTERDPLRPAER